jgi:hypothetical protein
MSGLDYASLAISSTALAAVIVSDVVIGMQQREMRRQTHRFIADARLAITDLLTSAHLEIGRALIEYPRLRPLFYGDEASEDLEPLTYEDELRARTIAENLLDTFDLSFEASREADVAWVDPYRIYFDDMMRRSPFIVNYLRTRSSWYPGLLELAEEAQRTGHRDEGR